MFAVINIPSTLQDMMNEGFSFLGNMYNIEKESSKRKSNLKLSGFIDSCQSPREWTHKPK